MRLISISKDGKPEKSGLELNDHAKDMLKETAKFYERTGFQPPWISYLGVVGVTPIGICSFKSPPESNQVELAYFTFPSEEGCGFATEMARQLVEIAKGEQQKIKVIAQTLTTPNASHRVLSKLGFSPVCEFDHPSDGKVLEWHL